MSLSSNSVLWTMDQIELVFATEQSEDGMFRLTGRNLKDRTIAFALRHMPRSLLQIKMEGTCARVEVVSDRGMPTGVGWSMPADKGELLEALIREAGPRPATAGLISLPNR